MLSWPGAFGGGALRRVYYGWFILAAGFVVLFFSGGASFAFGLLLKPMAEDLHWSRSSLSLTVTLFMFVSAIAMAPVGRLVDRYGPRRIIALGTVASAAGLALTGTVNAVWQLFLVYGVLYAVGHAATSIPPVGVMVSRWFERRRGIANGAVIGGNALGRLVIITVMAASLSSVGWRMSYVVLGVVLFVVIVPVAIAVVKSSPVARSEELGPGSSEKQAGPLPPIGPILASRQLWVLVIVYGICGLQDYFMVTHVVAFALDQGVGPVLAGNLLALMGAMGLVGVLASGFLADAFGAKNPTTLCFVLRAAIFAPLIYFQDTASIVVLVLLYGITLPVTAPLTVVFAGNMFGSARLGTVSGILNMVHQMAGGIGAILGALVFDRWGSYDGAFLVMLALSIVSLVTTRLIRERLAIKTTAQV